MKSVQLCLVADEMKRYIVYTMILLLGLYNNVSTSAFRSGKDKLFFECDLLNKESIDRLFNTIAFKVTSGIDILVNNAGKLAFSDRTVNLDLF